MSELPLEQILQLGSTAVVSIFAIWALVQVARNRKNNKGNNKEFLKELKENHLKGMETKLDNLEYMGRETDKKLEKIILILIRIRIKIIFSRNEPKRINKIK